MSRSDYTDDLDPLDLGRWRGRVASAIRGKRGQRLLRDLAAAMDAMPEKRLVYGELEKDGCYCALGVVGKARGLDLASLDPEDSDSVAGAFDIASPLAREIVAENDDYWGHSEDPEMRWTRIRGWVERNLRKAEATTGQPA